MKEYKSNEELLNHLISKGVIVNNKKKAKEQFERYTYSIVNTYKEAFKTNNQYISGVTFEEIFPLYDFDKNLRSIFLKYKIAGYI